MKYCLIHAAVFALFGMATARSADVPRQTDVAARGAEVMPFSLKATTHIFTKTREGGIQRVIVKDVAEEKQIQMVRDHLHTIQTQFQSGDFSAPEHIHGQEMPGLAQLKAAKRGAINTSYHDIKGGAELQYQTTDAALVAALHAWFDAQLSDHGADAMADHQHHHGDASLP